MSKTTDATTKLYNLAMERAFPIADMRGLKGRTRRNAELLRSNALHAERMRITGLSQAELESRLASRSLGR